jgi:inorganic pyrophosphatase
MEDEEGVDTKIIAVPTAKIDPYFGSYKDVRDLPEMVKNKIKHFFEHYKELEPGKWVKLKNWKDANTAKKMIKEAMV